MKRGVGGGKACDLWIQNSSMKEKKRPCASYLCSRPLNILNSGVEAEYHKWQKKDGVESNYLLFQLHRTDFYCLLEWNHDQKTDINPPAQLISLSHHIPQCSLSRFTAFHSKLVHVIVKKKSLVELSLQYLRKKPICFKLQTQLKSIFSFLSH